MEIETLIKQKACTIIDVRTQEEFMEEHVSNSLNIPLMEIPNRLEEIEALKQPLVLCCVSGNRSGQAVEYLSQYGIECYNGGAWNEVAFF